MAKSSKHTIVLDCGDIRRKFAKILFTGDGSYSLTAPYHSAKKAVLFKTTVNYDTKAQQLVSFADAINLSELDEGRLKITHHRSGFVQYSGDGVVSGLDEYGKPKGLGVFSRPLDAVGSGPALGAGVQDISKLDAADKVTARDLLVHVDEVPKVPRSNGIMLEIHYFQPPVRRFVFKDHLGRDRLNIIHPAGFIVPMFAVYAPEHCEYPGVLGIELYEQKFGFGESGFSLSGPGENERLNETGERIADVLGCIYPRLTNFAEATNLDRTPGAENRPGM